MKKILLIILSALYPSCALIAKLNYDTTICRFSSSPVTPAVDQALYHELVWQCKNILALANQEEARLRNWFAAQGAMGSGAYHNCQNQGATKVKEYLQRIANPTSIRLLADLTALNFKITFN